MDLWYEEGIDFPEFYLWSGKKNEVVFLKSHQIQCLRQ